VSSELSSPEKYDALLFVSFGGPEGPDDVLPFMENVTRGRGIPTERLIEVSAHYQLFGGVSPINGQNQALITAIQARMVERGTVLPIYWGNRNWDPYVHEAIEYMRSDGVERAIAFVTSAFSSASGCRQYREDIEKARNQVGDGAPIVDKIRVYYNHPGFIEPMIDNTITALKALQSRGTVASHLAFTAHSIPMSMALTSDYEVQLREACRLVANGVAELWEQFPWGTRPGTPNYRNAWELVFQSRSGAPGQPWLEPDISDHLSERRAIGDAGVVMVPIGFISDHMEVVYDLDTQALQTANQLGLPVERAATVGTDPRFVEMICALIDERQALLAGTEPVRLCLGDRGPNHDVCPQDCCPLPQRPVRPTAPSSEMGGRPAS
jgi:protoporphyrin/coproporphyrin ferrochelatase